MYTGTATAKRTSAKRSARLRPVLGGTLRERAGASARAILANAVDIGIGTK
jgi:hypothetical protein